MNIKIIGVVIALITVALLAGCGTASFYYQAIKGQWELSRRSQPIEKVLEDTATAESLRAKLREVQRIREFAVTELSLPDNNSYRKYADLNRPFVVWNVFAAPELSIRPKEWCFPFAGCVGYRGYFQEADARAFGDSLRQEGYDVYVGGVPAYSTLGYFDDPVLNTFIGYAQSEVARLIFHELAHQVVYLKGDSTFNESFATAVELEGVKRWIARMGNVEQQRAFDVAQSRKHDFLFLIEKHRAQLASTYEDNLPDDEKRRRKASIFSDMRKEYAQLKSRWGGYSGYDPWMYESLNNAQLASLSIYTQLVPAFEAILRRNGNDMKTFYAEANRLAKLPEEDRQRSIASASK